MPTGVSLTEEQRKEIYEARMLGERPSEIARAYGIKPGTVWKVVKQQQELHKEEEMAQRESVIAGDKKNGRLVSTGNQHHYIGTCIVNGKSQSKVFTTVTSAAAIKLWTEWCNELRGKGEAEKAEGKQEDMQTKREGQEMAQDSKEIYVVWAKGDTPRLYAAFTDMELALKEVERINEVASFLVSNCVFEIESVPIKG